MSAAKVMISLPKALLDAVDRAASEEHRSRSDLLREGARLYLQRRQFERRPGDDPEVQQGIAQMDLLAQSDRPVGRWDTTAAVRRTRRRDG